MLGRIAVDVVRKDIKNIHLSVYPPEGAVRIAAPLRMPVSYTHLDVYKGQDPHPALGHRR